ncbi:unnamed protein product [Eruca vesicaria subsp. sativa]|uniref:Bet v I/Major latex protein domain-containing protein n=1 Tax=Eruca vesicaria subsp. sativa TaxID=29727 RepID=A0ABC8JYR3_ERUVS|nr:unnamed protein product [Eruca vesicaria subsp. sativa]
MATSGTYVTEVPLKGRRRNITRGGRAKIFFSLMPSATTFKMSPFTMANGTPTGVSRFGTTHWEIFKEKREIDDENKTMTVRGLEGHVMELFKVYDLIGQFIPKTEDSCICKITMVWEKRNDDVPEPSSYMKLLESMVVDMEDHVLRA